MATSPPWKIYDANNQYVAAAANRELAAAIVAALGDGTTIRYRHGTVLWREGSEDIPAAESYDRVAFTCQERERAAWLSRNAHHLRSAP